MRLRLRHFRPRPRESRGAKSSPSALSTKARNLLFHSPQCPCLEPKHEY
jgi:hypothetical protein